MPLLDSLVQALATGGVEVIDLTAPLHEGTPILILPEPLGQTARFERELISRYDDDGPAWYWNNFRTGEHTGTHFDAPIHWVTGQDRDDVSQVPPSRLIGPAVVIDVAERVAADPDFLLQIADVRAWQAEHGAIPASAWLLLRTGWDARAGSQEGILNADEIGPHTPGM